MIGQTQRSVIHYSLLSFFGLLGAVLIAMGLVIAGAFALGADWLNDEASRDRLVWSQMALAVLIWLPFHLWCRTKIICPTCRRSLFQTLWFVGGDLRTGEFHTSVPERCRHCGAQLP